MKLEDYKMNSKTVNMGAIIENIKNLSESLGVDYNELVQKNYDKSPRRYKIPADDGILETEGLFKNKEIAVAISYAKANTKMCMHTHHELELVKMLEGEMHVTLEDGMTQIIKGGEFIIFQPYTPHEACWLLDSVFIAVTIPACDTWPEP